MRYHVIGALITAALNVCFIDGVLVTHGVSPDEYFLLAIYLFTVGACILQGLCYRDIRRDFYDRVSRIPADSV